LPGPLGAIDVPSGWRLPCSVNHWGEGVLIAATPPTEGDATYPPWVFSEVPSGICGDGVGGAFVLATCSEMWQAGSQGHCSLRHVSAAGVAGPRVLLARPGDYVGVIGIWAEAAIVESGKHRAICGASDYEHPMSAQRFDEAGVPQWRPKSGVRLTSPYPIGTSFRIANLVGEADGSRGAIFAWNDDDGAGGAEVHAQRVTRDGRIRWGTRAPRVGPIAGAGWPTQQPWAQLVATGTGGAIVVAPEPAGAAFRYVATTISAGGVMGTPTTLVASATDDWRANQRLRYAVPDDAGGLFLGRVDIADNVRLLRYVPATGVQFDIATGMIIDPLTLAVREDGRGGVLVGGIGGTPTALRLRRYDASGTLTWDIDAVAGPLEVRPVPGASMNRVWISRSVTPVPDGNGGAIVLCHELMPAPGPFAVVTRCFDAQGRITSYGLPLTSDDWGQTMPLAIPAGLGRAIAAYTQYENVETDGYDVSAQRVGCCAPVVERPPPPFGCEILPLPDVGPGRFAFDLPCGNETRRFGVIPLSRLLTKVPGLRAPTGLWSHDGPAPAWARLVLRGVPDAMKVSLVTLGGKRVANAMPVPKRGGMLTLAFAPPKDADLLVVVSVAGKVARGTTWSLDVAIDHGPGKAPAPGSRKRSARRAPTRR
jgi:hypothetical protein